MSSILRKVKKELGWFTLVELIVVITILVILGTIAFMSLSGFSGGARDSSRVSDLSLISKSLDIYYARQGSYPTPTGAVSVTYSGAVAWYQWVAGDGVVLALWGGGSKISKKPIDPLLSTEYVYSLASEMREYSLGANYEGSSVVLNDSIGEETAYAETGNPTITYIKGTYNGVVVKVSTGSKVNLLAVPNILVSSGVTSLTGSSVGFLVHGSSNSGGLAFIPKLVYSSGALPSSDDEKITFASGVISAYSGTSLASNGNVAQFIQASSSTGALASIGGSFVGTRLGGSSSAVVVSGGGTSAPSAPTTGTHTATSSSIAWNWNTVSGATGYKWNTVNNYATATDINTATGYNQTGLSASTTYALYVWAYNAGGNSSVTTLSQSTSVNLFASCTAAGQTYTASTTFQNLSAYGGWSCGEADKILCTGNGTGQIWSMCNVGATTTTNYNSTSTDRSSLASVDGKLFQFARNDPFDTYTATALTVATSSVATNVFTGAVATTWYYDWVSDDWRNVPLSMVADVSANIWTISPCQLGYHVPTQFEFQTAYDVFSNQTYGNATNLPTVLKMSYGGSRNVMDGSLNNPGLYGVYWSSSPWVGNSKSFYFADSWVNPGSNLQRAKGLLVRCIKN